MHPKFFDWNTRLGNRGKWAFPIVCSYIAIGVAVEAFYGLNSVPFWYVWGFWGIVTVLFLGLFPYWYFASEAIQESMESRDAYLSVGFP